MTKLNLEATSREHEIVKAYLEDNASETLAEKINNGTPVEKDGKQLINRKTLDGFMRYACDEARKLAAKGASSACIEDKVVFGWAIHYFEEDGIEGTLYNADGTEYKPVRAAASKPTTTVKAVAKRQPAPQMTLFDFMEKEDGETTETDVVNTVENEPENVEEDDLPSAEEIDEILAEIDGEDEARERPENIDMETGEILPAKAEKSESSVSPYEPEALRILQEIFGDEMVLRWPMRICDIRPIPKRILAIIRQADEQNFPQPDGHVRFYSYLTTARRELIKITVAVKHVRKKWFCKQVAIHGLYSSKCYVKDMEYCGYFGMGFRVGWYDEGLQPHRKWYEYGWCWAADKYYDPSCPTLNLQFVGTLPEFRYSAFEYYHGADILGYLRLYTAYPQIEYLMKLGLSNIAQNVTILKRCGKDKNFCKWLIKNRAEIAGSYHYIPVIMEAYKSGRPLADLQRYHEVKKSLQRTENYAAVKELFKDRNLEDLCKYLTAQKANASSYADYVKACVYLGLDMSLERNLLPHEFRRWHDIRIDEYRTAMTIASENKRKEFYARFEAITEKYASLQHNKRSAFVAIIARSPQTSSRKATHCTTA